MSVAASRYAKALLDVLYPSRAEMGRDQLRSFQSVLASQDGARLVFENPTLSTESRKDLLNKIGNVLKLDAPIRNFLGLLIDRNRLDVLEEIIATYESQQLLNWIQSSVKKSQHALTRSQARKSEWKRLLIPR